MARSSTALFVIDIQHDLVGDPKTEIPHSARIQSAGASILSAARELNATSEKPTLIVFVQHEDDAESGSLIKGSESWKLAFNPQTDSKHEILVAKTTRSTFKSNPGLAKQLKDDGIEHIIMFGVQSECCVQETSLSALEAGFQLTILHGAHSTYHTSEMKAEQIEESVEKMLGSHGAKVIDWEDAVNAWKTTGTVG